MKRETQAAFVVVFLTAFASVFLPAAKALARFEHQRIRRIVVFPFKLDAENNDPDLQKVAEDSWWSFREKLTEPKRFLVASRNFMTAKDVFQPRGELKPADALILGRLLDADALVTVFLDKRTLNMRVYETTNGLTLWSGQVYLHPSVPVEKQFGEATEKLLYSFIASFPYQGFVTVDPLIGQPSYHDGDKIMFKADVGMNTQIGKGDNVQLVHVTSNGTDPVFQSGINIEVYAEGVVTAVDHQIITVRLTRKQDGAEIKADDLVRVPDEIRRMREAYGMQEDQTKDMAVEMYRLNDEELTDHEKKTQPLVTSLAFIGNLALVLLIAF